MKKIFSGKFLGALRSYILKHKITSAIITVIVVYIGYWGYGSLTSTSGETRYVTASVTKGTIIASVTGSGQVSASNQIDLKPQVSATVTYIGVTAGQEVKAGALIMALDNQDAQKAVRDAQVNLDSAKLSLAKLIQPADELSITQAQNTLDRAKESEQSAQDSLTSDYGTGFNNVSNAFLDLPGIMSGLQDILYGTNQSLGGSSQSNVDYYTNAAAKYDSRATQYQADAEAKYQLARSAYDQTFSDYKATSRSSATSTVESIINETYATTKDIADAVKSANNVIQFYEDELTQQSLKPSTVASTHLSTLSTYTGQLNGHLVDLLNSINTIQNDKDTIVNATRTIDEDTLSLAKLKAGADPLDVQSAQLTVTQRQNALLDAQQNLANYAIRAPFDGTIAKIDVNKGDSAASGTVVATLITKQKLAEISLNEVDAAKIKIGQKTTLTFDAIDGLNIAGVVQEIDTIGTVTQGVVTYNVKIGFDTQDDRVKPGMTANAAIITDVRQDVLAVPNGAVKSQGNNSYVEIFNPPLSQSGGSQGAPSVTPPVQQPVQTGLSDDTNTEVVSGLKEGDQVVVRTITSSAASTASQAPSLLGGGNRNAGGAIRAITR